MNERIVLNDTVALAVYERGVSAASAAGRASASEPHGLGPGGEAPVRKGDPDSPTIVLTHGWPDSATLWDPVADRLAQRFHVVTFDARGIGRSTEPLVPKPYAIEKMADDIHAVCEAVSPDRPVHLVGHDWGSVQAWEYVGDPDRTPHVASYTSISGPCLDHLAASLRARLRRPTPRNVAPAAAQAIKSSYIVFLHVPIASTIIWRLGFARLFRWWLRRAEGVPDTTTNPAPTLGHDAIAGIHLYRTNILRRLRRPLIRRTDVPVQLVVNQRDKYVAWRLYDDIDQWAPDLCRRNLPTGHWVPQSHPDLVADVIAEYVDSIEARQTHQPLQTTP
ncbi:MAG: alpha/beta fold hydrolase [Acidimicrobiales bacterium]